MAELISFPWQVSEVVINQTEKNIHGWGGIEIWLSKSSGLPPFFRQKEMHRRSHCARFTGCIFHQWVSDGVLISVRLFSNRSVCASVNLHGVAQEAVWTLLLVCLCFHSPNLLSVSVRTVTRVPSFAQEDSAIPAGSCRWSESERCCPTAQIWTSQNTI